MKYKMVHTVISRTHATELNKPESDEVIHVRKEMTPVENNVGQEGNQNGFFKIQCFRNPDFRCISLVSPQLVGESRGRGLHSTRQITFFFLSSALMWRNLITLYKLITCPTQHRQMFPLFRSLCVHNELKQYEVRFLFDRFTALSQE